MKKTEKEHRDFDPQEQARQLFEGQLQKKYPFIYGLWELRRKKGTPSAEFINALVSFDDQWTLRTSRFKFPPNVRTKTMETGAASVTVAHRDEIAQFFGIPQKRVESHLKFIAECLTKKPEILTDHPHLRPIKSAYLCPRMLPILIMMEFIGGNMHPDQQSLIANWFPNIRRQLTYLAKTPSRVEWGRSIMPNRKDDTVLKIVSEALENLYGADWRKYTWTDGTGLLRLLPPTVSQLEATFKPTKDTVLWTEMDPLVAATDRLNRENEAKTGGKALPLHSNKPFDRKAVIFNRIKWQKEIAQKPEGKFSLHITLDALINSYDSLAIECNFLRDRNGKVLSKELFLSIVRDLKEKKKLPKKQLRSFTIHDLVDAYHNLVEPATLVAIYYLVKTSNLKVSGIQPVVFHAQSPTDRMDFRDDESNDFLPEE